MDTTEEPPTATESLPLVSVIVLFLSCGSEVGTYGVTWGGTSGEKWLFVT